MKHVPDDDFYRYSLGKCVAIETIGSAMHARMADAQPLKDRVIAVMEGTRYGSRSRYLPVFNWYIAHGINLK